MYDDLAFMPLARQPFRCASIGDFCNHNQVLECTEVGTSYTVKDNCPDDACDGDGTTAICTELAEGEGMCVCTASATAAGTGTVLTFVGDPVFTSLPTTTKKKTTAAKATTTASAKTTASSTLTAATAATTAATAATTAAITATTTALSSSSSTAPAAAAAISATADSAAANDAAKHHKINIAVGVTSAVVALLLILWVCKFVSDRRRRMREDQMGTLKAAEAGNHSHQILQQPLQTPQQPPGPSYSPQPQYSQQPQFANAQSNAGVPGHAPYPEHMPAADVVPSQPAQSMPAFGIR